MQQCKARLVQGFEAFIALFFGQLLAVQKGLNTPSEDSISMQGFMSFFGG